jgi:hypothetical protein
MVRLQKEEVWKRVQHTRVSLIELVESVDAKTGTNSKKVAEHGKRRRSPKKASQVRKHPVTALLQ